MNLLAYGDNLDILFDIINSELICFWLVPYKQTLNKPKKKN